MEIIHIFLMNFENTCCKTFKSSSMFWWNTVPRLWRSKVQIIDTVQIHVLCMPCKSGFPHPKVQICRVYTWKIDRVFSYPSISVLMKLRNCARFWVMFVSGWDPCNCLPSNLHTCFKIMN